MEEMLRNMMKDLEKNGLTQKSNDVPAPIREFHRLVKQGSVADCQEKASDEVIRARSKKGRQAIHYAARRGNIDMVEMLLTQGADIDSEDGNKVSPLHYAVYNNHNSLVKLILERSTHNLDRHGLGENIWDSKTPLLIAVYLGDVELIDLLLKFKPRLNTLVGGTAALHRAVWWSRLEIAQKLIAAGADQLSIDKDGDTPLHLSAVRGLVGMTNYLLSVQANPHIKNKNGLTPVDMAFKAKHEHIIELFLVKVPEKLIAEHPIILLATMIGSTAILTQLLTLGYSVRAVDPKGINAFHYAVGLGKYRCASLLLDKDPELINLSDKDGDTPLHMAAIKETPQMIEYLLSQGADPEIKNQNGLRPIEIAVAKSEMLCIQVLLEHGCRPNETTAIVYSQAKNMDYRVLHYLRRSGITKQGTGKLIYANNQSMRKYQKRYHD